MLTLLAGQAESLWDEALPVEVRELPADLAELDVLLSDPGRLAPIWYVGPGAGRPRLQPPARAGLVPTPATRS